MYQLSPNIELLFTEAGPDLADRIRAAAAAGFDAVEMWGTLDRDVPSLAKALADTGVSMTSVLAEPRTNFAMPWETMDAFFAGLDRGVENARLLGSPRIVLGSGSGFGGAKADEEPRAARRDLHRGRPADPGLGREAGARGGQHPGRPSRRAAGPHRRRRAGRPGGRLGAPSACSTTSTTRSPRARTRPPSWPTPPASSTTCRSPTPPAAASPAAAASTGPRAWPSSGRPATTARSGWSTCRRSRRRPPSSTSAPVAAAA